MRSLSLCGEEVTGVTVYSVILVKYNAIESKTAPHNNDIFLIIIYLIGGCHV